MIGVKLTPESKGDKRGVLNVDCETTCIVHKLNCPLLT